MPRLAAVFTAALTASIAATLAIAAPARADRGDLRNALIGPVIGLRLSGPDGDAGVYGVEGGLGIGPERFNVGFVHRADRELYYVEFDPWLWVGGSLGLGVDSAGEPHGIVGLWEGFPVAGNALHDCPTGFSSVVTLAGGIRYTGVVELYVTLKAGVSESFCF